MRNKTLLTLAVILGLGGCSNKYVVIDSDKKKEPYKIEVSTRSNDARAVINTGKVLKIWIKSYVSDEGYLMGAQDVYVYVEKPGFNAGIQSNASGYRAGVVKENGKIPIHISPNEIDRSDLKNDEVITQYLKEISQKRQGEVMRDAKLIEKRNKQK